MPPDVLALPGGHSWPTDVLAKVLDVSAWSLNDRARKGQGVELPDGTEVRPLRAGRCWRWPAEPIRQALSGGRGASPPDPPLGAELVALDAHSGGLQRAGGPGHDQSRTTAAPSDRTHQANRGRRERT